MSDRDESWRDTPDVDSLIEDLVAVRNEVRQHAREAGRTDLITDLDESPIRRAPGPVRVVVAGETNRGKSQLVNALVGRPLLSPVGVDVTTACWVHVSYGVPDQATVLLADASSREPRRISISMQEVEQYVSLQEMAAAVLGVEIQIGAPILRQVNLVDTPGVGGLVAGHAQTTLVALQSADALLFVCDSTQPVLAPEVEFLVEAARRVPTIAIAVTKSDNPGSEIVVAETLERLRAHPELGDAPVFSVSARLAEHAAASPDPHRAARLASLAGLDPLIATLTHRIGRTAARQRIARSAELVAASAHQLAQAADQAARDLAEGRTRRQTLQAEIRRLSQMMDDHPRLTLMVENQLAALEVHPRDHFEAAVNALRTRYVSEAERAPAAQLKTLALRMAEEMTAAGVAALEEASEQAVRLVRGMLVDLDAESAVPYVPLRDPRHIDLHLARSVPSQLSLVNAGAAGQVLQGVAQVMTASAGVSVLTGAGLIAASIALVACAGWWLIRAAGEQQRRSQLREWVERAAADVKPAFAAELEERVASVRRQVTAALPGLISTRQEQLRRAESALEALTGAGAEARDAAAARLVARRTHLNDLARQAGRLAARITSPGASR